MQQMVVWWQPARDGVRLVRMWGESPCVGVPDFVEGKPVVEIGARCFASAEPVLRGAVEETVIGSTPKEQLAPLCGRYVEEITLPKGAVLLANAAFSDCRKLHTLTFGPALQEVGSDLFLNCWELKQLVVQCAPETPTALRKLLAALPWDVSVRFAAQGRVDGCFFYPEYEEYLDENTPAHIFNLHIHGEGYRYRQCFSSGALAFAEYDQVFLQAQAEESAEKLCRLAFGRLLAPAGLSEAARTQYETYLQAHPAPLLRQLIAAEEGASLQTLLSWKLLPDSALQEGASKAAAAGWSEGAALLLRALRPAGRGRSRYSMEEFSF